MYLSIEQEFGENHVAVTGHFTRGDTKKYYTAQGGIDIHDTVLHDAQFSSVCYVFQSDDGQSWWSKRASFSFRMFVGNTMD